MLNAPKASFLLAVAEEHPTPFCALKPEVGTANELVGLGLLNDLDAEHPGCFGLSPKGVLMVAVLERRVSELP